MRKIFVIALLFYVFGLNAQAPQRFYTRFGGDGDDIAYSGKPTVDGQYIVVGSSSSYGVAGNTDVYMVKVDSMGFPMWQHFFGGTENDIGRSVIQLADSGYVIAGYTNSFGAGGYDAYVIRTNKNGNLIWQKTFGGLDWDFAYDLVQGSDGNIFVVGNTSSFGNGKKDGYVLKIDLTGNLLVQKYIGGAENEELKSIIKTNDNYLATVGYTESKGEINGDGYFLKLDLNADTLFTRTFGGPFKDYACDIVQKGALYNFDYYISGAKTYLTITSKTHSYMYRISSNGSFLSDKSEFRNGGDEAFISLANSYHLSYLTGFARSVSFNNGYKMQEEAFVADLSGFFYLVNASGGSEDEFVYSIEGTKDGGYISVGSTLSYGSNGVDIYFIKRDSTIIKYPSVVGVMELQKKDAPFILHKEKSIDILFINDEIKRIEIIDINGKVLDEFNQSELEFTIDISNFKPGVYLIYIRSENGQIFRYKFIV